ncbi:MAG: bile acid:sodium symporter family protein [Gammaproteobacteria bacterium]|nr:bile acid:sodium symporter family protein [Gammaproteobacteria bacterium]
MSLLQRYFPMLAISVSTFAYLWPSWLAGHKSSIVYLLGVVMFCMGSSLRLDDFSRALRKYPLLLLGIVLQFGFMPLIAWQLSTIAGLSAALTAGMILVGSVPGGTASNVICYISKADVALSITLTAISTCLAIVVTPLLAYIYLNQTVEVNILSMMTSIFYIVVLPVGLGVVLNQYLHIVVLPIQKIGADISIILICFIIAIIVALNRDNLLSVSPILVGLVLAHNIIGLFLGYITTLLFTRDKNLSKTIAIEVGMQNSGLAVALAVKFFGATSALPGALFSIIHNVTGSLLASYWAKKTYKI